MDSTATRGSALASAIALALGLCLIGSRFLLDYGTGDAGLNVTICGTLIAGWSAVRVAAPTRAPMLSWLTVAVGIWLGLSAAMFVASAAASCAVGAGGPAVAILALHAAARPARTREPTQSLV